MMTRRDSVLLVVCRVAMLLNRTISLVVLCRVSRVGLLVAFKVVVSVSVYMAGLLIEIR